MENKNFENNESKSPDFDQELLDINKESSGENASPIGPPTLPREINEIFHTNSPSSRKGTDNSSKKPTLFSLMPPKISLRQKTNTGQEKNSNPFDDFLFNLDGPKEAESFTLAKKPKSNTGQEKNSNPFDAFLFYPDDSKEASSFTLAKKPKPNTGKSETKSASRFSTTFKSMSTSPKKIDKSPNRQQVETKYPDSDYKTSLDSKNDNNPCSDLNLENTQGVFGKFLPQTIEEKDKLPSSPRTPTRTPKKSEKDKKKSPCSNKTR